MDPGPHRGSAGAASSIVSSDFAAPVVCTPVTNDVVSSLTKEPGIAGWVQLKEASSPVGVVSLTPALGVAALVRSRSSWLPSWFSAPSHPPSTTGGTLRAEFVLPASRKAGFASFVGSVVAD